MQWSEALLVSNMDVLKLFLDKIRYDMKMTLEASLVKSGLQNREADSQLPLINHRRIRVHMGVTNFAFRVFHFYNGATLIDEILDYGEITAGGSHMQRGDEGVWIQGLVGKRKHRFLFEIMKGIDSVLR